MKNSVKVITNFYIMVGNLYLEKSGLDHKNANFTTREENAWSQSWVEEDGEHELKYTHKLLEDKVKRLKEYGIDATIVKVVTTTQKTVSAVFNGGKIEGKVSSGSLKIQDPQTITIDMNKFKMIEISSGKEIKFLSGDNK